MRGSKTVSPRPWAATTESIASTIAADGISSESMSGPERYRIQIGRVGVVTVLLGSGARDVLTWRTAS